MITQIVSGILHLQATHVENADTNAALQSASARVHAIAAVHQGLYTGKDIRVVSLDVFLASLCSNIGDAMGGPEPVQVELVSVEVPTDMAIPLALAVNELLTNSRKYGRPPYCVSLKTQRDHLVLTVRTPARAPPRGKSVMDLVPKSSRLLPSSLPPPLNQYVVPRVTVWG